MTNHFRLRPEAPQLILNFMLAAVTSILTVRLFLHLTNNFQLTFGRYHIAHVFWGGLIMTLAFLLIFLFSSPRVFRSSAIIAGFGWGWFIDEIGKYITRDNNYWYQPAVIYIYFALVSLYLIYRFTQTRFPPRPPQTNLLTALSRKITRFKPLFIALALYSVYHAVDNLIDLGFRSIVHPAFHLFYLKIIVDLVSSLLIIFGWFFYLSRRHLTAIHLFRLSLLTNIFLGAVVKFYFEQFSAVFSLAINLLVLTYLNAYKTRKIPTNLLK